MSSSCRKGRHGDVRAESGGDGPVEEEGRRDPSPAVRGDLGALRRDPVPAQRHREPAGATHLCHGHAAEHVQVTGARGPGGGRGFSPQKQRDKRTSYLTQTACERTAPGSDWHSRQRRFFSTVLLFFLPLSFLFSLTFSSSEGKVVGGGSFALNPMQKKIILNYDIRLFSKESCSL